MRYIDLRSDTVTQPTPEMREAMRTAKVGDDVYRDDPTIIRLEEISAKMLGKEAAIFVPTGTFGNELAVFTHCARGDEVIVGEDNHLVNSEQGGMALIAGVQVRALETKNGQMDLARVEASVRKVEDIHFPNTGLIAVENAHSCGRVLPMEHMAGIKSIADKYGIPVHLDGARIFNAAETLGVEAKEIADLTDSVMFCLSKGLCAPIGSMLVGSEKFITAARRKAKLMGGGMRQVGVLAAPGIIAAESMSKRLGEDHRNARLLASLIKDIPGIGVDEAAVEINMVFFTYDHPGVSNADFVAKMREKGVKISGMRGYAPMRFCTHNDVSEEDVRFAAGAMREILG